MLTKKVLGNKGPSGHNDLHDMLENVNNLLENETERLLSWRGEGRELVCQSLPRGYAEKCFDFDCIKVDQIILIFRGTQ